MKLSGAAFIAMSMLMARSFCAGNPFLDAEDDKPVSANFRGAEWGDEIAQDEIALTARVITTRIAKMPWGAIFKIEFTDLKSQAKRRREIPPDYFIVTDDRIVLLNEENNDTAVKKISALETPPPFEPGDIYGIVSGKFSHEDGPWTTTIELNGEQCIYLASHNSGHFKKVVWKKGVGLIEYSSGYGAMADGYRLKRVALKTPLSQLRGRPEQVTPTVSVLSCGWLAVSSVWSWPSAAVLFDSSTCTFRAKRLEVTTSNAAPVWPRALRRPPFVVSLTLQACKKSSPPE
jgi:hypothetical protein